MSIIATATIISTFRVNQSVVLVHHHCYVDATGMALQSEATFDKILHVNATALLAVAL